MARKITRRDLTEACALQREALHAIERGNYDAAFQLAGAIDQIFYKKGIDLVEATEYDLNLENLYRKSNGQNDRVDWRYCVRPWGIDAR